MNGGSFFSQCMPPYTRSNTGINAEAAFLSETAFQSLNEVEKDRVKAEMYGTHHLIEETEEFVNNKIQQMNSVLQNFKTAQKESYLLAVEQESLVQQQQQQIMIQQQDNMAQSQNNNNDNKNTNMHQISENVTSEEFLLIFLRSEHYNESKAAMRLVRFFDQKRELFGVDKLWRKILQDDLNDDDKEVLRSGFVYASDKIDHQGRITFFLAREHLKFRHVDNLKRAAFYYAMNSIQNSEISQRRGVVLIIYNICSRGNVTWPAKDPVLKMDKYSFVKSMYQSLDLSLPLFKASIHHCSNNYHLTTGFLLELVLFLTACSKMKRARYLSHNGNHQKVRVKLIPYGIATHLLPVDQYGEYHMEMLYEDLKKRNRKEHARENENTGQIRNYRGCNVEECSDLSDMSSCSSC